MTTAKHTPGPWILGDNKNIWTELPLTSELDASHAKRLVVKLNHGSYMNGAEAAANAAHIVRCVNAHDDLVAALREIDDLLPRVSEDDPMAPALADWLRRARAALAKAQG